MTFFTHEHGWLAGLTKSSAHMDAGICVSLWTGLQQRGPGHARRLVSSDRKLTLLSQPMGQIGRRL